MTVRPDDEFITGWVTKYALTSGIQKMDLEVCHSVSSNMAKSSGRHLSHFHGEGRHWHRTLESAVKRAEEMRWAKIASLKKSIARLEKMKFE